MKVDNSYHGYFREYLFHQTVEKAREDSAEIIPISQARAINARIHQRVEREGTKGFLAIVDEEMAATVPDYRPQYGDHTPRNLQCMSVWGDYLKCTGQARAGAWRDPALPISPYDPRWADRSTVQARGTALVYALGRDIEAAAGGETGDLAEARHGGLILQTMETTASGQTRMTEAGPALTDEDASGLTVLASRMSEDDYTAVKDWVLSGARDPRTGQVDRTKFLGPEAVARSAAVLDELRRQGVDYEVQRDLNPGQIRARVAGQGLEIRLLDTKDNERFAGARVYSNGTASYYTTNRSGAGLPAYVPTPQESVDLLRVVQGRSVPRVDGSEIGAQGAYNARTWNSRRREYDVVQRQASYHAQRASTFVVRDLTEADLNGQKPRLGDKVVLHRDARNSSLSRWFSNETAAEAYLAEAVESARANYAAALDVDGLVQHFYDGLAERSEGPGLAEEDVLEPLTPPAFCGDPEIAAIQRSYWDVLTGRKDVLLRPGVTEEMYADRIGLIGEDLEVDELTSDVAVGNLNILGSPQEKVTEHAEELLDDLIGTAELQMRVAPDGEFVDQRFDPVRVAAWMSSESGQWQNMESLAAALRVCGASPDELMGEGFNVARVKDKLIRFDEDAAVSVEDHPSELIRRLGGAVRDTIERNGASAVSVQIDDRGVIRWEAVRMGPDGLQRHRDDLTDADGNIIEKRKGQLKTVSGELGQVFDVGRYGEIVTDFASGENMTIVPGYEARISAQAPGEMLSVEERTRLRGYEQLMTEQIQYQVASDLLSGRSRIGDGANLNRVYSRLYGTRHPVDFVASAQADHGGVVDPWTEAILRTEARRVHYSNAIKEGSTIHAEYTDQRSTADPADDNHFDAWRLTEGRNMAVLDGTDKYRQAAPAGYFDPMMTGGAKNQGIVRYLTEGAEVDPAGVIIPSPDPDDLTPLMKRPELASTAYDPFDRRQMTTSALMQSAEVTEPTGVALMTFGGWTADDPIVVSQEFARAHRIRGTNGELRDLVVGDKLSDLHGNKGVVSLIVDRDMAPDLAAAQDLAEEVAWFRANPDMDVVMSPFSLISRRNAGSARELMAGETGDLVSPRTGEVVAEDGFGRMRFVVTHMAVDAKTKIYDEDAIQQGQGRKASAQLAWALGAQDCDAVMAEFYGHNAGAEANFREMLGSVGLDMEADGTLRVVGRDAALDDRPERRLFEQPDLIRAAPRATAGGLATLGTVNTAAMRREFGTLIGTRGGDMEIPWPLTYPTGERLENATDTTWRLPVLSSHLRSGQEFEDGTSVAHDYTSRYLDIHEAAIKYRDAVERLPGAIARRDALREGAGAGEPQTKEYKKLVETIAELEKTRDTTQTTAQSKFTSINNDLAERAFSGRHNIFKDQLMSSRLADSATAVWTSDPRLDIDQVAMGPAMAQALGLEEGDHALVWRDPILHDGGLRYLRVTLDERLTGVAINPVMDKCFDGDFDGDSVAVVKLHTEAAKAQALEKLSVPANLLDTGVVKQNDLGVTTHPFAMQVSLDTSVALAKRPGLRDELARLSGAANLNAVEPDYDDPEVNESVRQRNRDGNVDLTGRLSDFYRDAQRHEFGTALTFTDPRSHIASVEAVCVDTGAKGSISKLRDYQRYLGVDENGVDTGVPGITASDQRESMYATAVKTFGTGLAGSFSQRAVKALRNDELKAVLELTYPVTQSVLQAKHDAAEARHKYEVLMGPGRELWRGRLMEQSDGRWVTIKEKGEPVQATKAEWAEQFVEFYGSSAGFNVPGVNPVHVERVAEALSDGNGVMRNLEDDRSVAGSLMDRMAYGGDLTDLMAAAKKHENIFDGERNEQFASAATRRQRHLAQGQLESFAELGVLEHNSPMVDKAVVKSDVLADTEASAKLRGSSRRSRHVVTASAPVRPRPTYVPSDWTEPAESDACGLEL